MEILSWMFAQSLHRFLTSKRGHFFNFLQEWNFRIFSLTEENLKKRVKSSCTKLEIFLSAFSTRTQIFPYWKSKQFWKELQEQILKCCRRKRKPPSQTGTSFRFLFSSSKPTSLPTTMRSPRREFRPARDARYRGIPEGLPTPVPAPLRRTNNEDDDAQRILARYTYTKTSAPFLDMFTSVLRLDVRFVVLALARSLEFRWKTVETVTSWHLRLDNTACPLPR